LTLAAGHMERGDIAAAQAALQSLGWPGEEV
jgi:hypothetical protein